MTFSRVKSSDLHLRNERVTWKKLVLFVFPKMVIHHEKPPFGEYVFFQPPNKQISDFRFFYLKNSMEGLSIEYLVQTYVYVMQQPLPFLKRSHTNTGWWFQICFIFTPI